ANVSKHIIYVYEPAGSVVVHYTDEDGDTIKDNVVDENNVQPGTQYNTTDNKPEVIKTPDGKTYTLVAEQIKGTEQGVVEAGKTTEVTYVYKEVKGNVIIHYVDEAGKSLQGDVTDMPESSTGIDYDTTDNKPTTIKTEDGKTYVIVEEKTKGNESGKVVEGTTEVTYVYKEVKGNVVVNYTDEDGKVIKDPVTDTDESSTGTDYNTTDNKPEVIKTPDGKTYKLVPEKTKGNETGKVVEGTTEVTYVYKEVKEDTSAKVVENTSSSKIKNLPKTGDISNIGIYGSLLSLSGGLLALLGVKRRKEEEE
ncbi:TPA: MucBP domain-containing protein, partial [Streptococcus equi subsp. zooepidemicus]|nr:MucBP domain-containing protein [Streptococcus equi subsp. zooepidemicus]